MVCVLALLLCCMCVVCFVCLSNEHVNGRLVFVCVLWLMWLLLGGLRRWGIGIISEPGGPPGGWLLLIERLGMTGCTCELSLYRYEQMPFANMDALNSFR